MRSVMRTNRAQLEICGADQQSTVPLALVGLRYPLGGKTCVYVLTPNPHSCQYIHDPEHVLSYEPPKLQEDMIYEEFPVSIIAREVRKLRNREIPYVKVRWSNHDDREATWEPEDAMKERHPHLFEDLS
uniref:Chromo domain-containing protein n=1 Tax=Ananas comosus var. bracteatus TaxID=296719 RepID=A0A6V7PGD8_ANACO|nr:unnamed protein product [Ananas comosus var. bracteatus]